MAIDFADRLRNTKDVLVMMSATQTLLTQECGKPMEDHLSGWIITHPEEFQNTIRRTFEAGYDIRDKKAYAETFKLFDKIIGLNRLRVIHLNDSKKDLGSRVDRHEHIGKGFIGLEAFRLILNDKRFEKIPKILETPKEDDWDKKNLTALRSLYKG